MWRQCVRSYFASKPASCFKGNIAVIIGVCNNPIGAAIAVQCVEKQGIHVAMVDIEQNKKALTSLHEKLLKLNKTDIQIESFCVPQSHYLQSPQMEELATSIQRKFRTQSIQLLFNNVDCLMAHKHSIDIPYLIHCDTHNKHRNSSNNQRMREMMEFNFWSVLSLTRSFLPLLMSKQNMASNTKCFIVNTSSFKSACLSDSIYSVSKYCLHALSELIQYELTEMLNSQQTRTDGGNTFSIKLKLLCPGFVRNNTNYNLVNISHRHDALESNENLQRILNHIEICNKEFGQIVFDGIRNDDVFLIETHPKLFRIYASDKLISVHRQQETRKHLFTKRLLKSILSKL